ISKRQSVLGPWMALKLDQQVICGRPVKICCALKERTAGDNNTNPTPGEANNVDSYSMEKTYAAEDPIPALAVPNEVNNGNYFATTVSSGKIKRRSCYECGEKGHLSTACPKKFQSAHDQANAELDQVTVNAKPAMLSYELQKSDGDSYTNETYTATNEAHSESLATVVSIGKIKRRSCYECGEKGHLSTACPKKLQNTDHTNSKLDHQTVEAGPIQVTSYSLQTDNNSGSKMDETYAADPIAVAATNGANDGSLASAVSIGKIKRRICYECGLKGHLSTACPKKQQK
ncbi:hypothetical protein EUTSA_v100102571mg, partial [Eutrema salsugineum]